MKPLAAWPLAERRGLLGVLTDIDDTLTTDGVITPDALQALADLKAAGLAVIAITGRPVGWSEPFARSWPVDAIVAENGAVALHVTNPISLLRNNHVQSVLSKIYLQDADTRRTNFVRMQCLPKCPVPSWHKIRRDEKPISRSTTVNTPP